MVAVTLSLDVTATATGVFRTKDYKKGLNLSARH